MASIKINRDALMNPLKTAVDRNRRSFTGRARMAAEEIFRPRKAEFMNEFDSHKVTVELLGHEGASKGVLPVGNLFSFIGFDQGSEPAENLRRFLRNSIYIEDQPSYNSNLMRYYFKVVVPTREEIVEETEGDLERWGAFDSWVYAIEEGISNINNYLYKAGAELPNSASGPGLQVKKPIRSSAEFSGVPYLTSMLENFSKQF